MRKQTLPSDYFDERAPGVSVDTLVIHSMYHPDKPDDLSVRACKERLDAFGVSAHYLIDRQGEIWQMVPEEKRAWHTGESRMPADMDSREGVNQFSIGIELIATESSGLSGEQYQALAELTAEIASKHLLRFICGHCHIAPERKSDPWKFDWVRYQEAVKRLLPNSDIRFPAYGARPNSGDLPA